LGLQDVGDGGGQGGRGAGFQDGSSIIVHGFEKGCSLF
jgi:hypothetical protein